MTSSSDILNKRYLDFNEGFDQWRLDTEPVPNIYEKKDLTTGAWVETVPVTGGGSDDDSSAASLAPYREINYPPTNQKDEFIGLRHPGASSHKWQTQNDSDSYYDAALLDANYAAVGDFAVICSRQHSIGQSSEKFLISNDGRQYERRIFATECIGGQAGIILSIIWDGLRFVMLHANTSASGAELHIYWSDTGTEWAAPPNASGAIFVTDSTYKYFHLHKGNIPGEVLLIYYSTAELDGITNAYHTAHSTTGFDVPDLDDASIIKSTAAFTFPTDGFVFKVKDNWVMISTAFSTTTHQISTNCGEDWADFTVDISGGFAIKYFGLSEKGVVLLGSSRRSFSEDGINWTPVKTGGGNSTSNFKEYKSGMRYANGRFVYCDRISASGSRICEVSAYGKRLIEGTISSSAYPGMVLPLFRGWWSFSRLNSDSGYVFKE